MSVRREVVDTMRTVDVDVSANSVEEPLRVLGKHWGRRDHRLEGEGGGGDAESWRSP